MTRRCRELEEQERKLHDGLADHLRGVLAGKRLILFREILEDLEYPDVSLIDENMRWL